MNLERSTRFECLIMETQELERALDFQEKGYQLILWLGSLADGAKVSFDQVHEAATMSEAARRWLERHRTALPERCRIDPEDVGPFANVVASFLSSSFDLVAHPGTKRVTDCGCICEWCSYAVAASHLRTKKVSKRDKARARRLQADLLMERALKNGRTLSDDQALCITDDERLGEAAAVITYADELIRRMKGLYEGPAVLALWRRFAWNREGSPKKNFRLTIDAVRKAEARIQQAIQQAST
jgi:hypothetical protein